MITLAIDAMSGDNGVETTVAAAVDVAHRLQDIRLILVGDTALIDAALKDAGAVASDRLYIRAASQVVTMDEAPAIALRKKKDSSMRVAINLVRDGEANACVSAGNTGALIATARFVLKTIKGIERPAICSALPKIDGYTYMLDLGANVECSPELLFQFGLMGSVLVQCLDGNTRPSIGLLNIGVEDIKGNDTIKAAASLFRKSKLNYHGYVEADEIYTGDVDLIVCDGFVGNVSLKTAEGVSRMIINAMREEFKRTALTKGAALLAKPVLEALKSRLDHRRYNGASFLGIKGAVIKSHGSADALAFSAAIERAYDIAKQGLVQQIEHVFTQLKHL